MSSDSFSSTPASSVIHGFPEEDLRVDGRDNPGYFPAWLGMRLLQDGRYVIVRKLGWGQFSSVWLVRDLQLNRFGALKILTCQATSELKTKKSAEIEMLKKIASADRSHSGRSHVMRYYDDFELPGPHGLHRCILTEVLGFSLDHLRREDESAELCLAPHLLKPILRQVLLGLDYLHNACGIVHADLKFDNIMFRPDDVDAVVTSECLNKPSQTYNSDDTSMLPPVVTVKSQELPISTTVPAPGGGPSLDAVIADFGDSYWKHHHLDEKIQSYALRAPEVTLGYGWSTPADIWSVGCLTVELLAGFPLFEPNQQKDWDVFEDHLARMTESLEEHFPLDMIKKSKHSGKYFKEDGSFSHFTKHLEPNWPLRDHLVEFSNLAKDQAEVDRAAKFLKRCLRLKPEDRSSAKELAEDPWLL